MNIVDIIIVTFLLFGFVRGVLKGLLVEVASLVALVVGVYGAIHFSYFVGDWLKASVSWSEKYISLAAFAITFIIIVLSISLLGKILTKVAGVVALGILNKLLGGVFGMLKIGVILSVVFMLFEKINNTLPLVSKEKIETSIFYSPIAKIAPTIFPIIMDKIDNEKEKNENAI